MTMDSFWALCDLEHAALQSCPIHTIVQVILQFSNQELLMSIFPRIKLEYLILDKDAAVCG